MSDQARVLWVPQLSAYYDNKFDLSTDSNWQLIILKLTNMLRLSDNIVYDILVPRAETCHVPPDELFHKNLGFKTKRVNFIYIDIARAAARTRYDFNWEMYEAALQGKQYTHVYLNDPMMVRHIMALFSVSLKHRPKFILQNHFLDTPAEPLVPADISYWHGTVEGCLKTDVNFWHSAAMREQFLEAANNDYAARLIVEVDKKSHVWKSGYSLNEITSDINEDNLRFDKKIILNARLESKKVVWIPNRVGGLGKSLDYANAGKFLFEIAPALWEQRKDFIVIAGNPNQKISNDEIASLCPPYVKLIDTALNRDEYKYICRHADIVVGLYGEKSDRNGGLASLEAIELGALPLFPNVNEYKTYFDSVDWPVSWRVKPDLSDATYILYTLMDVVNTEVAKNCRQNLVRFLHSTVTLEATTKNAMMTMGLPLPTGEATFYIREMSCNY